MADTGDIRVVLNRIDEIRVRIQRRDHSQDIANSFVGRVDRRSHAPRRAFEQTGFRGLDAERAAGHGMTANEANGARQELTGPFEHLRLGRSDVGDHSAAREQRRDIGKDVFDCPDRRTDHDDVGIADGLGELPLGAIDRVDLLGVVLLLEVGVKTDDFERLTAALRFLNGPGLEAESDRTSDQSESDDGYSLHSIPSFKRHVCATYSLTWIDWLNVNFANPALETVFGSELEPIQLATTGILT